MIFKRGVEAGGQSQMQRVGKWVGGEAVESIVWTSIMRIFENIENSLNFNYENQSLNCVQLFVTPWSTRHLCPWDFSGRNIGVGCYFLLQGIFLTQGSNSCLLHFLYCRWILYHWAIQEIPLRIWTMRKKEMGNWFEKQ